MLLLAAHIIEWNDDLATRSVSAGKKRTRQLYFPGNEHTTISRRWKHDLCKRVKYYVTHARPRKITKTDVTRAFVRSPGNLYRTPFLFLASRPDVGGFNNSTQNFRMVTRTHPLEARKIKTIYEKYNVHVCLSYTSTLSARTKRKCYTKNIVMIIILRQRENIQLLFNCIIRVNIIKNKKCTCIK